MVKRAILNKPLFVYGDGKQTRAFCYVSDAIRGTELVMKTKKANGEVFNVGNDKEYISMLELAYKILKLAGKKYKPKHIPMEKSDRTKEREVYKRTPDLSKIKRLGYKPRVSIDEGIRRTIEYKKIMEDIF